MQAPTFCLGWILQGYWVRDTRRGTVMGLLQDLVFSLGFWVTHSYWPR